MKTLLIILMFTTLLGAVYGIGTYLLTSPEDEEKDESLQIISRKKRLIHGLIGAVLFIFLAHGYFSGVV